MTTPATAPAPAADAKATPAPAAGAAPSATETKQATGTQANSPAKGESKLPPPLVTSEGAPSAGEKAPASASESDFTEWPEGFDDTVKSTLSDLGKELAESLKLDGPGKKTALTSLVKRWQTAQANAQKQAEEAFVAQANAHVKAAESHEVVKQLGGIEKARTFASEALKKHGSKGLNDLLTQTGLAYHPEVLAFFAKVGRSFGEDSVAAGGNATKPALSERERLASIYTHPTSASMF